MKRHWVVALIALAALPCVGHAQSTSVWGPAIRLTPYIGISPGITQEGVAFVFVNGSTDAREYELEFGAGLQGGVNAEYRFWNRFSGIAGLAYARRGGERLIDFGDELVYETDATNLWMAKAGLAMRLAEPNAELQLRRLNASIFIAPALIHDVPSTTVFSPPAAGQSVNHWGLNLGADAELPLGNDRMAFNAGVEDWIVFWNDDGYRNRIEPYIQSQNPGAVVAVEPENTHMVVLRFGLTWRF
jgi:hypothetical protein